VPQVTTIELQDCQDIIDTMMAQ